MQAVLDGRRIALLERFTVDGWVDAVRRHRPKTVSLVPTALRMVLDAEVDDDVFTSIRSVVSGTAPLDPDLADAFTARYGVPVLGSYGATEFGGGVAGWNLADHQQFGSDQARERRARARRVRAAGRRSRPRARRSEPTTSGCSRSRASQLGTDEWVRTTDLARLDADGFLFIVGRADETILRGGYKVQPEVVRAALERDPGGRRGERRGRAATSGSERCRWPRSNADPAHDIDEGLCSTRREQPPRAVRGAGRDRRGRRTSPHRVGEGRSRRGPRARSPTPRLRGLRS